MKTIHVINDRDSEGGNVVRGICVSVCVRPSVWACLLIKELKKGTDCKILLGSVGTKSFISKQYYLRNNSLHGLTKFSSKAKVVKVGN